MIATDTCATGPELKRSKVDLSANMLNTKGTESSFPTSTDFTSTNASKC